MLYKPTVVSLFSGCGGLDLGFKQAGFNIIWANEIDRDAVQSYKRLINDEILQGDLWSVINLIPKADILIGGPPCQSFSLVGKRLEDDPRGNLVFAFLQAVDMIRPSAFVMENVPGLTASKIDGERLHIHLAKKFHSLGYDVRIEKIDSSDYFVPQRRKRVLLIGTKINFSDFIFINDKDFSFLLGENDLSVPVTVKEALCDLPTPTQKNPIVLEKYKTSPMTAYSRIMRATNGDAVTLQILPTMSALDIEFVKHIPPGGNYRNIPDEISTIRIMKFKKTGGRTTTYGRMHPDQPAFTINTYFNRPNVGANYHYIEDRLITPREALRLQSFPDAFTPYYTSMRSLHKQIGNAVPPLLSRAIAESLIRVFNGK